ncbi:amidohydrolase [Lysinibacillus xylanilyticus]|uniref:Amidohydrolase n=1 Tax=Lysinibacillus xylanilyticus TaxID=582475 RepID=A0ABT4EPT2_9BACI|nr:amidohydrolase [Lysinibacillus xylanilyticus]MCY9547664.1 amidohydrolase [Lysinibacillus xylanilyticus]
MKQWLTNVLLETGEYLKENDTVGTKVELFHLEITDGFISQIVPATQAIDSPNEVTDMKGKLLLPAFKEMHNHLDKTYLSLPWKACVPVKNLKERLTREAQELSVLATTCKQRASAMIEQIVNNGANHIRTHVNIDPYIGLKNLEGVLEALDDYKDIVTAEVIAFPQHGLLRDNVPILLREALRNGATMIGGLDPAGIDNSIERSLDVTMDIAHEFNVDVDIHLHDGGHVGYYTIDKWIDMVEESKYQGRTAISHAFALGDVSVMEQHKIADRLAQQQVKIMSTVPFDMRRLIPPIDLLTEHGVDVHFGFDGFYDSWNPNGSGDILEKVTTFADLSRKLDERSIRQTLKYITNGITPLDADGQKVWPNVKDEASFVFFDAVSSAEVIARRPLDRIVMSRGKFVK